MIRMRSSLWFMILGLLSGCIRAADKPDVSHTLFHAPPSRLIYFDDTTTVMYHDGSARNVYRSNDEGKTWEVVQNVPQGESYQLIEHPFDRNTAFILSKGKKHYRTIDRGQNWQSFETDAPPSVGSTALEFHATKWDWIMYTGEKCSGLGWLGTCYDVTYVTQDAFASSPRQMFENTSKCSWAHATKDFNPAVADELVLCIAFEPPKDSNADSGDRSRSLRESRLYSSRDFFKSERSLVDFGIGRDARGLVGIGNVKGFIVVALKPSLGDDGTANDEMILYVTTNANEWTRARFPHGHGLRENAYTIVDSTKHSLVVDVLSTSLSTMGTLFTSDSTGSLFVPSLPNTNRNLFGIVDFEALQNIEGVAIANVVANADSGDVKQDRQVQTRITFDDGAHWDRIKPPEVDHDGKKIKCDVNDASSCSLHLHSVTQPHNYGRVFSSTAPGLVMAVGSIGDRLLEYDECDTFLSTDAGLSWRMVHDGAHKYEFGDAGSILVMVDDEEATDELRYSLDMGQKWQKFDFGVKMRVKVLTTIPDSTSLKFLLIGTLSRKSDQKGSDGERDIVVFVDFAALEKRKCEDGDMERWYARRIGGQPDCLMGHKQWFLRRKADADCFVMDKFKDPIGREEDCECTDEDYECDFGFIRNGDQCEQADAEKIPEGECKQPTDKFRGSSGFRKIPGDTCRPKPGPQKDDKVLKACSEGQAAPGQVSHQRFEFPSLVLDQAYFGDKNSHTIIAYCTDNTIWQSSNEGFSWSRLHEEESFVSMSMHTYDKRRAYLITRGRTIVYTTDEGQNWSKFDAPTPPNPLGLGLLDFHPTRPEWLIWTGSKDCETSMSEKCRAVAYYSQNNGRSWSELESYVRTCSWARDSKFKIDERSIFCESYRDKSGSQRGFDNNALEFIASEDFFRNKRKVFDNVVGFATFEEYMVTAEIETTGTLNLMVSLDGRNFARAHFPPNMKLETSAYTVLESVTDSIFLHVTTHQANGVAWGSLFKSNSNGTYYSVSLEHANRNDKGYVDFEKMVGLEGIALMNVVSNPDEAAISGSKKLQTRITHNDGGRWKPLSPPAKDSLGQPYPCSGTACTLNFHGYTERTDPRATYSSPSATGLMIAVGSVGHSLAPYADSDTFLTRNGGFTWEEIHKDAHMWEYGDQGSILLLVNDEGPTDRVAYSLNEGLTWQDYRFGDPIRVRSIVTVPADTSRKFILLGVNPSKQDITVAVHLDFSKVTNIKCVLDLANPNNDDFELWSPSEDREERCLFGKQTMYHRRLRDRNCYIGERLPQPYRVEHICTCSEDDFEWSVQSSEITDPPSDYNYQRDPSGKCVLVPGAEPLGPDTTCAWDQQFWYERTAYRKVPHSSCQNGLQLDRGNAHVCPAAKRHGVFFWLMVIILPCLLAGLFGLWWSKRRIGAIRLPEPNSSIANGHSSTPIVGTLQSIPYWALGLVGQTIAWFQRRFTTQRGGYRNISAEDDAELLNDYED